MRKLGNYSFAANNLLADVNNKREVIKMSKRNNKNIPDNIHAEPKEKPQLVPDIQASTQSADKQPEHE